MSRAREDAALVFTSAKQRLKSFLLRHNIRFHAKVSKEIQKRQESIPLAVRGITWKAQLRLTERFRTMANNGKPHNVVVVAMVRELAAFMWAIAQEVPITNQH